MQRWRRLLIDGLLTVNRLAGSGRMSRRTRDASALVFAPHPDDEVLGCGGVIALKAQARARVTVVVMTDGRASHRALIAEDALVRIRRDEAGAAALQLGLTAADYRFLDFEDHRLAEHHAAAVDRVAGIVTEVAPDEIYLPHRHDGTIDHDATNQIVRKAVARVGRPVTLLEYPVWLWNAWPWTAGGVRYSGTMVRRVLGAARDVADIVLGCRVRIAVGSVRSRKVAALAAYRSQVERRNGDPRWQVLSDVSNGDFLQRFETGVEIFRRAAFRP